MPLRPLPLPDEVPGKVYLYRMPGRTGDFGGDQAEITAAGVQSVVCLTPMQEIEARARDYADAITRQNLPWKQVMSPMVDFGLPEDRDAWLRAVRSTAEDLRKGGTVMIHCAFGIGRTGTTAIGLLLTLGMTL